MAKNITSARRDNRGDSCQGAPHDLREYERKRDFAITSEPSNASRRGSRKGTAGTAQFVVQKHDARRLHYDFRLELEGVLKSWAVPKGPSLDPTVKRLAVHVEDHPLDYAGFEGRIPQGQYGAGDVIVWDRGEWQPADADPEAAYRAGKLKFHLLGEKLSGGWTLVRTRLRGNGDKQQWLLIKEDDSAARAESDFDVTVERPESVLSHATLPDESKRPAAGSAAMAAGQRADVDHATAAPLPARLSPELATLVQAPPAGEWHYEVKFDGYRVLARSDGRRVQLFTRSGLDSTNKLPSLAAAVAALGLKSAWLDGEIVVLNEHGLPDFQALQNALESGRCTDIIYYLFDIPYHNGLDLRATPLEQRRALLKRVLEHAGAENERLRYSEAIAAAASDILRSACKLKLEGVIGKRAGSSYVSRRSPDWIKLKCQQRQEFVIGGLTRPRGSRSGFGALLLGVYDADGLRYAGRVGTGFSEASLKALSARLQPLIRQSPAFSRAPVGRAAAGVTWLEPRLLCEVEFAAWTANGKVRHAVFHGLREDKSPPTVVRERAVPAAARPAAGHSGSASKRRTDATIAGIPISHPGRVIDAESGVTKLALAEFYRDVAPRLLPQLAHRPLAIVRAPDGVAGEQFFQRHAGTLSIPGIRVHGGSGEQLMEIPTLRALIGAVQMGTIELHTWNAVTSSIDRPDRMIFDLDPDPTLPWPRMVEATRLVLTLLDELGLQSFLKTSGGKGVHVVVPLARRHDWTQVKDFSKGVAQHLARLLPQRFTDRMGPKNRVGKIFVDYLRNQPGGTTVAAYSVRARPGLGVSVPITRDEIEHIGGAAEWTVRTLAQRLATLAADPWAGYVATQRITRAMVERLRTQPE
jgi:bifunctional non-homologous end joining protein LigD